jgi:hypothetical protein
MRLKEDKNKKRVANYIRYLFRLRFKTFKPERWNCILRADQLKVVRRCQLEPTDYIIMDCFLLPEDLPSKVSIYLAVRKNWQVLSEANIEVPIAFDGAGSPSATSNNLRWLSRLMNLIKLPSRVRSFIAKRIRKSNSCLLRRYF